MIFLQVVSDVILPIFILIALGVILDRAFDLDIRTISRIGFNVLSPALVFDIIFSTTLSEADILRIGGVSAAQFAVLGLLALLVYSVGPLREHRPVLTAGTLFTNSGNYGIPLMLLAFGPEGVGINAIYLLVNIIALFTLGVYLIGRGQQRLRHALLDLLKVPVVWAIIVALGLRLVITRLPDQVSLPIGLLADSYIPLALMTLGMQLSRTRQIGPVSSSALVALLRLLGGPAVMYGLVTLLGLDHSLAAVLVVAAAMPTAVNVYIISLEYERAPELASQIIFLTTLASALTVPMVILFTRLVM
ncbi:MAG: AEC family transporter [Anaerolineae bacterium]